MSDLTHFVTRDCYPYQSVLIVPGPVLSYPIAIGAEGPVQYHVLMVLSLNIVCFAYFCLICGSLVGLSVLLRWLQGYGQYGAVRAQFLSVELWTYNVRHLLIITLSLYIPRHPASVGLTSST